LNAQVQIKYLCKILIKRAHGYLVGGAVLGSIPSVAARYVGIEKSKWIFKAMLKHKVVVCSLFAGTASLVVLSMVYRKEPQTKSNLRLLI
jgi:hypothetical protein